MINEKQQILQEVNTLPDNTTWEDAIYTLELKMRIKRSEEEIKNGKVITLEQLDNEMEAEYEDYYTKSSKTRS